MKKILFIIPYIPYPLDSGGNQAFFNMVNYIRNRMSVSILLCSKSEEHDKNIVALKKLWANVDFFVYNLKSATPFPKCYLHKEKWTFDS